MCVCLFRMPLSKLYKTIVSVVAFLCRMISTLPRDLVGIYYLITVELRLKRWQREKLTVFQLFRQMVKLHANKPCMVSDNLILTFKEVEDYSNRIAHVFREKFQLKKGDVVALFMENRPEFVCIWLGLSKLGVIAALINTNLKSKALIHSITVAKARCVIYSSELAESIDEVKQELDQEEQLKYITLGSKSKSDFLKLENLLSSASSDAFYSNETILPSDVLMYIYTSGTTGLPKPAIIKHQRYLAAGAAFFDTPKLTTKDIIYITLPIYHAHGGIIGTSLAISRGATIVIRKKFSATNFWKDCIEYKCTAIVYVGELLRYLVNQPESHLDKKHSVRIAIGNGLRANVWTHFVERFAIRPFEFYAASEGNCTLVNINGEKVGACGFLPLFNRLFQAVVPICIIKTDNDLNPIRDSNGSCIRCGPNEKGLLIGMIKNTPRLEYQGYANNKQASEKKIINDVFKKGQRAFNTGDLMMQDEYGWIFFCDRLGETFRWRGENVSTVEVENIISERLNSTEVIVYGVEIPGAEGRAGMATIVSDSVDLAKLADYMRKDLAAYARPMFIRLVKEVEHTGTFKVKKNLLVEEAYNVNTIKDKLFYFDTKQQVYLQLTKQVYESIQNQKIKF